MSKKIVAKNKNATRNYEIIETIEAGIVLRGSEVKALRESKAQINEAFARFDGNELWILGFNIAHYSSLSSHYQLDADRKRKLLLNRYELDRLKAKVEQQGLSIVAISIYFVKGKAKMELGIGRGKKLHDKRHDIAKRDSERDARREMSDRNKYG